MRTYKSCILLPATIFPVNFVFQIFHSRADTTHFLLFPRELVTCFILLLLNLFICSYLIELYEFYCSAVYLDSSFNRYG